MRSRDTNVEPVRIAMLAPAREQCGISDYSRFLIDGLQTVSGVDIVRCAAPPEIDGGKSIASQLFNRHKTANAFKSVSRALTQPPVQLLHIQHEYFLFGGVAPHRNVAAAAYNGSQTPIVLTVHEIAAEVGSAARRAAINSSNRSNFLHRAIRGWIVHTEPDKDRLAEFGVNRAAISVIPVGVPQIKLPSRVDARRALNLDDRRVVTLFGFLSSKKGHADALEALTYLPKDVVLVFAGGRHPDDRTEYVAQLDRLIQQRNLDNVTITGFLKADELAQYLAATDAAVAPYISSSGSASVTHLLAAGIPTVAYDIPVFREIADAGSPSALLLTSEQDSRELANAILRVLENDEVRRELRQGAAAYTAGHSYTALAPATAEVYRRALA